MKVMYGDIPVPWTVAWTTEDQYWVADCPAFHVPAMHQNEAQGERYGGRPRFGEPHVLRQRLAHGYGLCDLCAKPLKGRSKYAVAPRVERRRYEHVPSMDDTDAVIDGLAEFIEPPMLHGACLRISIANCPALRQQIASDQFHVLEVYRHETGLLSVGEARRNLIGDWQGPEPMGIAAFVPTSWKDVTGAFL